MTKTFRSALLAVILFAGATVCAGATSRIKDLANIEGVRQNQLIGYGLVVGLNGTGDTLNNIPFTKQSLHRDAGAPRRQHPRANAAHRQRRRGDGDRQPARLRAPRAPAWTSPFRRLATPRACRAALFW